MRAVKVSKNAPVNRMFESDFFEFFSHIHPWQPPLFFIPLITYVSWRGFDAGVGPVLFLGYFAVGLVTWTLLEYTLHRFLFHFHPTSKIGKRLIWLLHGVHHDWPNDKLRLVFPPTLSLPLAALFFGLFTVLFGDVLRYPAFAGIATGYLAYDMIHYYVHHFAPKNRVAKFLRAYHLAHHFKNPESGYGVSSPLWDYVFRSTPGRLSNAD
ncbi:sterol desaturase family protein [Myxococcota bacterium]|nr:sterol desaturase family protein [Myxococcota bacterium]